MKYPGIIIIAVFVAAIAATGCAKKDLLAQKDRQIADLDAEVVNLEGQLDDLQGQLDAQRDANRELEQSLADLREKQQVWIEQREGLMHITLDGSAGFGVARADLTDDAKRAIDRIAASLERYPDRWVLIEGHTDERAIADSYRWKYPSNWELSTARANAVLHYLTGNFDLDPARLKAVGYAGYHPVDDRSTPEAWSSNRRVVITIGSRLDIEKYMASRSE